MLYVRADDIEMMHEVAEMGPAPYVEGNLPGPIAADMIAADAQCSSPSHTRDYPLVARRASGSIVEDVDGNRFLDFAAGIAVCATGHCHPRVVAAIQRQAADLIHLCGSDFYYGPMIEVCQALARVAPGAFAKRVLLVNSGTEAVEAALKLSRFHTQRKWIIAFHGAFHGRTMGSLSLTSSKARQKTGFGPFVPMVAHVPYGDADAIENTLFTQQMAPKEVAAIFVEPILGEGGYVVPPPDFLPKLRALCDQHGILLVCDEIQSGMGRTGKMFAVEHFDVDPDIVLSAKGLASGMPLGAVIARADVMNWPPGAQGSTFGGNPVSCAAALATIELLEGGLVDNAARLGAFAMDALRIIAERRRSIANVRGLGLMIGVDVVNRRTGKPDVHMRTRILQESFRRGLILLPCGACSIRFCPPLCINRAQLEAGLHVFDEAVATVQ